MRKIIMSYNPYRLETEITIDGKAPKLNSKLNFGDRRLQEWIEEFPQILSEECSTHDFELTFHGTILDFEDVDAMVKEAKKLGINFKLDYIPAKEVADKEEAIAQIFSDIQEGPFEELKQPDVIKAFNMAQSSDFEVNVVATMSAGKSTLINSLLQKKLMPAKQEACTATITEIKDNDASNFIAKAYNANGNLIETDLDLNFKIMERLNSNPEVSKIRVEGNIPFVTADDVSLVLVDTPGPNNSRDPEHKAATYRMLSESSKTVVLYILNATQLAVNDDYNLLSHVADSMKVGGKQSRDRFIFVVNKLDEFKKGEDSVESAINKVRDYLHDNGIENPNIYPASALTALNIRTVLTNPQADEDDIDETELKVKRFCRNEEMHFEKHAPLTPSVRGQIETMLEESKSKKDTNTEALIHTGIVPIEMAIRMYVQKYAKTAKIKNIVDTFTKKLESAHSFEATKQEIAENQDKREEVLATIASINKKLESGKNAATFKTQIDKINYDAEIRKSVNSVIVTAQQKVTENLKPSNGNVEEKMEKKKAEMVCKEFEKIAENLQAEVQVKLDELIERHIHKNAIDLLNQYKQKLSELSQDIKVGDVAIDPFVIMEGEIKSDTDSLISDLIKTESVKVGEKWVSTRKWYKPWTWFGDGGYYSSVYEDREYVNFEQLANRFFAPIQERIYENSENAINYAKEQTRKIKKEFSKKFDELDEVLKNKLKELEDCASDRENIERRLKETESRLAWLESIQARVKNILDI